MVGFNNLKSNSMMLVLLITALFLTAGVGVYFHKHIDK